MTTKVKSPGRYQHPPAFLLHSFHFPWERVSLIYSCFSLEILNSCIFLWPEEWKLLFLHTSEEEVVSLYPIYSSPLFDMEGGERLFFPEVLRLKRSAFSKSINVRKLKQ